jgi:C-8 sterol isomerase
MPVFDPLRLREAAAAAVAASGPRERMFAVLLDALDERYPGLIARPPRWVLSHAGGALGQFTILYGSLSEYLLIFGTPIGAQGYTGRFRYVTDWAFFLSGEACYFAEGDLEPTVRRAGETMVLERRTGMGYRFAAETWILEYARGAIPTVLPFGLADAMLSTLDYRTVGRSLGLYGRRVIGNWLRGERR